MAATEPTVAELRWEHRNEAVFTVDGHVQTWDDVVAWARCTGAWRVLETETRARLACRHHASTAGVAAPPEEVRAAAAAFRYGRGLISGEETEAWLEARHLTVARWMQTIRDGVLCDRYLGELATITDCHPVGDGEVAAWTWPTAVSTGALDGPAHDLAGRLAVVARVGGSAAADPDVALARFRMEATSPSAMDAVLTVHRLDWLRVELDHAELPSDDAAREAILCVRDDGLELVDVVRWAGGSVVAVDAFLEDLEPSWRHALLAAREGDLVGPLPSTDGAAVLRVRAKFVATLADPEVARRAEERLVARAVQHEIDARVRWHVQP